VLDSISFLLQLAWFALLGFWALDLTYLLLAYLYLLL